MTRIDFLSDIERNMLRITVSNIVDGSPVHYSAVITSRMALEIGSHPFRIRAYAMSLAAECAGGLSLNQAELEIDLIKTLTSKLSIPFVPPSAWEATAPQREPAQKRRVIFDPE